MAKMTERKYGPKARTKNRDITAPRFVARKAKFGDAGKKPFPSSATSTGGYVKKATTAYTPTRPALFIPRAANGAPLRASATGYVKKMTFTPRPPSTASAEVRPYAKSEKPTWGAAAHKGGPRTIGHTGKAGGAFKKYPKADFGQNGGKSKFGDKKPYAKERPLGHMKTSGIRGVGRAPRKAYSHTSTESLGTHNKEVRRFDVSNKKPVYKSVIPNKPRTASASWGKVASWYDSHLSAPDTYHEKVILPNLLRLVDAKKGEAIVDLACGQGMIAKALVETGAKIEGVDVAPELIAIAVANVPKATFHTGDAASVPFFADSTFHKAIMNLAIQNIEDTVGVLTEAARILKNNGTLHVVMNHPAFRNPQQSAWGYDDKKKVQYRRVDQYLSNAKAEIDMHPGFADAPHTLSFHRPLQYYFKAFAKAGFAVTRLEEWISHRESDSGPRARAENNARKEFPLFLYLEVRKQ